MFLNKMRAFFLHQLASIVLASFFAICVFADEFTNPPSNLYENDTTVTVFDGSTVYNVGQTVNLTWSSNVSIISRALRQSSGKNSQVAKFLRK
jgi:hypothetical protein